MGKITLGSIIFIFLISFCCFASEIAFPPTIIKEPQKIKNDLYLATDSWNGYVIVTPRYTSEDGTTRYTSFALHIKAIGWDDQFILVKSKESFSTPHYYQIINIESKKDYICSNLDKELFKTPIAKGEITDHYCTTFEDFNTLREKLGVDPNIELRDVEEVYEELE